MARADESSQRGSVEGHASGAPGRAGDGPAVVRYRERVLPSRLSWIPVPALAALSGLAVAPVGVAAVVVAVLGVGALVAVAMVLLSPVVVVTADELVAGRARISRAELGRAVGFDGEHARHQRGPALDARAHLLMRGWADGVVRVEVLDAQDPTPYWLVSTHRPEALARALQPTAPAGGGDPHGGAAGPAPRS